jgi:hypothetical protein
VNPADEELFERLQLGTRGAARLLRGMARRGKALERDEPERAVLLLAGVSAHPLYKGGRLAFDMLEVEDLMLDEPLDSTLSVLDLSHVLGAGAATAARIGDELLRLGADGLTDGTSLETVSQAAAAFPQDVEGTAAASSLPRVQLRPARTPGNNGTDERPGALDSMPELQSSDYLFDLVVLGFLDVVARQSVGENGR